MYKTCEFCQRHLCTNTESPANGKQCPMYGHNVDELFIHGLCKYEKLITDWYRVSCKGNLSDEYIIENKEHLFWRTMCMFHKMSEDLMRTCADFVDWEMASRNQTLSEAFIEEFADRVDWFYIVGHQEISEDFIKKHEKEIDESTEDGRAWYAVLANRELSEQFIIDMFPKFYIEDILKRQSVSEKFIREHVDEIDKMGWSNLSANQDVSIGFVQEYSDKIDWTELYCNKYFSDEDLLVLKPANEWRRYRDSEVWDGSPVATSRAILRKKK